MKISQLSLVALASIVLILIGGIAAYFYSMNQTTTTSNQSSSSTVSVVSISMVPSTSVSSESSSSSVNSVTKPCTAEGVQCGRLEILNASLKAPSNQSASIFSVLNITVSNNSTGGLEIRDPVQVFLNSTFIGNISATLKPGESAAAAFDIPSSKLQITSGANYTLSVQTNEAGNQTSITAD
jgi:hypothetical protein